MIISEIAWIVALGKTVKRSLPLVRLHDDHREYHDGPTNLIIRVMTNLAEAEQEKIDSLRDVTEEMIEAACRKIYGMPIYNLSSSGISQDKVRNLLREGLKAALEAKFREEMG